MIIHFGEAKKKKKSFPCCFKPLPLNRGAKQVFDCQCFEFPKTLRRKIVQLANTWGSVLQLILSAFHLCITHWFLQVLICMGYNHKIMKKNEETENFLFFKKKSLVMCIHLRNMSIFFSRMYILNGSLTFGPPLSDLYVDSISYIWLGYYCQKPCLPPLPSANLIKHLLS